MRPSPNDLPFLVWTREQPQVPGTYLMLSHPVTSRKRGQDGDDLKTCIVVGEVIEDHDRNNLDYWLGEAFKWVSDDGRVLRWAFSGLRGGEAVFRNYYKKGPKKGISHPLWFARISHFPARPVYADKKTKTKAKKVSVLAKA